jgi:1-acyl-sn-glycerol-3-phosphate acyltransferase
MRVCLTAYQFFAWHLSFFFFGVGGLSLNLVCLGLSWFPGSPGLERFSRRLSHGYFSLWVWWLRRVRMVIITYEGWENLPRGRGLVVVANHPGLMDIICLLARLPEAICIFKPAIRRNPVLGAAARSSGYLGNDGGLDLIRDASAKVAAGQTLLVFPEGTRTCGGLLNPFKSGFAFIAQRARAPIQTVCITCDTHLLTKGRPWWRLPHLPAHVTLTLGKCFPYPETHKVAATVAEVEGWFNGALCDRTPASGIACAPGAAP